MGEAYKLLKTISHLSVWLGMILKSIGSGAIALSHREHALGELKKMIGLLQKLDDIHLHRHKLVIEKTLSALEQAILCSELEQVQELYRNYLKWVHDVNIEYAKEATELQLTGLDTIITAWQDKYAVDLNASRVLIVGPHGPREGLIEKQFFQNMYLHHGGKGAEKDNQHVIYVEMLPEQMGTIAIPTLIKNFLGGHQINKTIGRDMLGDEYAMFKDVLASYAGPILDKLHHRKDACPYSSTTSLQSTRSLSPI